MSMISKVDDIDAYKKKMTEAELIRLQALEKELAPSEELVMIGKEYFLIGSFDMSKSVEYSKLQGEYREILKTNPNITFEEMLSGDDNIIKKIIKFLEIDVDVSTITYKQWKYLLWVISKNYVFTSTDDSDYINSMSPFFFV